MFNAIGAHIYAGGFTIGVAQYFNVLGHLEHAAYGIDVVKLNFPDLPVYTGGPALWPKEWLRGPSRPRFGYANPPCAIWSGASAGRVCSWEDDPRLVAHHDIFSYFLAQALDVFAIESVTAVFSKGRRHVDDLISRAASEGYSTTVILHDARYIGVPQVRKRAFLVFHRVTLEWELPEFTDPLTVREVLSGVKLRKPAYPLTLSEATRSWNKGWLDLVHQAKPGDRLAKIFNSNNPNPMIGARGQTIGRPGFLYCRVPLDRPMGVMMAGVLLHHTEDRVLHQDEVSALCTFPRSWRWPAGVSYDTISGYASRGVMPKVGEWLAGNVARALEVNHRINQPRAEVLDITGPPGRLYELQPRQEDYVAKSVQVAAPRGLPDREEGEGSGAYIRRLLSLGAADDAILERVHAQFPGSKATKSDVAYNKAKLKKLSEDNAKAVVHLHRSGAGPAPPVIVEARAPKYAAKAVERLPFDGGTSSAQAVSALRAIVNKKATVPGYASLLNHALDLLEKL